MVQVSNKKCIRNLSGKSLRASKTRNGIAVLAIALTTVLFTALFTIAMTINESFQQANFRQVGGYAHGGFKYLTEEQYEELKEDPLIKEYGLRRFLGMPLEIPFNKSHVEVGYSDSNQAHWMFCNPVEGRLPEEGTNEAATDTKVLSLLGITPRLGTEFTVTFPVDGKETTQTFTLCGWWEGDEVSAADHILIPESRVNAVLDELSITPPGSDGMTGSWNMDIMFQNSRNISGNLETILAEHGYQSENRGENYIATGVNWGYTGAQMDSSMDPMTVLAIGALLLLIVFTGYLIIYNVFQISVVGDIRFYGLLKTIGTTGRQIRRIIRNQALLLCVIGIPIGLLFGWLLGARLSPLILSQLNGVVPDVVSVHPLVFAGAALFSLFTVLLSCRRPGRMAARVSPVEAVRYTEGSSSGKTVRKGRKGISLLQMAWGNLGRNRGKTVVTILSLSLAVVLLNATVLFVNGFDMEKYLADRAACDFIFADAGYFSTGSLFSQEQAVPEDAVRTVASQEGITGGGRIYGSVGAVQESVTEEYYRMLHSVWMDEEEIDASLKLEEKDAQGKILDSADLYGMEPFALGKLKVAEGDLSTLTEPGSRSIAAVYLEDDYGNLYPDSNWAKLGDTVKLRYVEEWEAYNPVTGEVYTEQDQVGDTEPWARRAVKYREEEYRVDAIVTIPVTLSYRYYGNDAFVLNDQTFIQDTQSSAVMLYAFDTTEEASEQTEQFLKDYTTKIDPDYDYESKERYEKEFSSFQNMILLLGGVLSFIIGLVGILNFFNAILTGIITRKREFAMLQSIGMTGKQLKTMLVEEGLLYALSSVVFALIFSLALEPAAGLVLGSMFWFFSYQFTLAPILVIAPLFVLLGCLVPLAVYRTAAKQTIVERLRSSEN